MFTEYVRAAILPSSVAQSLPAALREWYFTGHTIDHEEAEETCQLCGKEKLRYHFEIENGLTSHQLMVGSQCILRFDVEVRKEGKVLGKADARKRLAELTADMQFETCLKAMRQLQAQGADDILARAIAYFERDRALSPKLTNALFIQLGNASIKYQPSLFTVQLRKAQHIADFGALNRHAKRRLWPALSAAQRAAMDKKGFGLPVEI